MGGSGSGGVGGGGGGGSSSKPRRKPGTKPGSPADPCDISFTRPLDGIQKQVLASVTVGDVLSVNLASKGQFKAVTCESPKGVVGTLAGFPGLTNLIECLEDGVTYSATVTKKTSNSCTVAVRRTA